MPFKKNKRNTTLMAASTMGGFYRLSVTGPKLGSAPSQAVKPVY